MITFDDIREFSQNPPKITAWSYLQSLNREFGGIKVGYELYCWYTADAFTISYRESGTLRLLNLQETLALLVLHNVQKRLSGGGIPWGEFTLKLRGENYVRTQGGKRPDPISATEPPSGVSTDSGNSGTPVPLPQS